MPRKTILTTMAQELIAFNNMKSGFDSLAKRANRRMTPIAQEVYERTKKGGAFDSGLVALDYRFESKDKARTLSEGISEFSKQHPEYGTKLKKIISQTRKSKQRYLQFDAIEPVGDEVYQKVLDSCSIPAYMQENVLENIKALGNELASKREGKLVQLLIK